MNAEADRKSLAITLNGALFGFATSMILWCLCSALNAKPLVPELISDAMVIVGLIIVVIRARRVVKR